MASMLLRRENTLSKEKKKFTFSIKKTTHFSTIGNIVLNKSTGTKLKDILVFGVPLADMRLSPHSNIPLCLWEMLQLLRETLGGREDYFDVDSLIPNSSSSVGAIRTSLRNGTTPDLALIKSPLVVAEFLRTWLSELPEPLFSSSKQVLFQFKQANDSIDIEGLYSLLQELPSLNYNCIQQTVSLLADMVTKSHNPHKQLKLISVTLGPLLLKSPAADDMQAEQILAILIEQYPRFFARARIRNNIVWRDMYDQAWWEEPITLADRPVNQLTDFLTASTINVIFDPRVAVPDNYTLELTRPWNAEYVRSRCLRDKRRMVSHGPNVVTITEDENAECDFKLQHDHVQHQTTPNKLLMSYFQARDDFGSVDQLEVGNIFKEEEMERGHHGNPRLSIKDYSSDHTSMEDQSPSTGTPSKSLGSISLSPQRSPIVYPKSSNGPLTAPALQDILFPEFT